jgi:DNA-binding XRE family transcriptional regulator
VKSLSAIILLSHHLVAFLFAEFGKFSTLVRYRLFGNLKLQNISRRKMKRGNLKSIPNCLRKYRKIRGLKQKQVAVILGVKNTSMICRWEKGESLPNIVNVFRLAILYRTMPDALFLDLRQVLKEQILGREKLVLGIKQDCHGR